MGGRPPSLGKSCIIKVRPDDGFGTYEPYSTAPLMKGPQVKKNNPRHIRWMVAGLL